MVELFIKGEEAVDAQKVDKGVAEVAGVPEVDGEVEEVEVVLEAVALKVLDQVGLRVLVGNVPDHDRRPDLVVLLGEARRR